MDRDDTQYKVRTKIRCEGIQNVPINFEKAKEEVGGRKCNDDVQEPLHHKRNM